jgi:asparagine synthase (glutamine-hydrolysing)
MSGVAGVFRLVGPPDLSALARMTRVLDSRGPDARTEHRLRDGGVGVTACAPNEAGDNPAWDPAGRWWVATDGELLNRRSLSAELTAWGMTPLADDSAAVAACIFAENGFERGLERLAGDVAIVAWDGTERRLWATRDRAGQRPLHYVHLPDGTLLFASEPAALLAHPEVDRTPDGAALAQLLALGVLPAPRTPWRTVKKLAPGERLSFGADGLTLRAGWQDGANPPGAGGARYRWARSARFSTELAVQQRVLGDAPLAVALSGGAYAEALLASTTARRRGPVLALTLGADGPGDERPRARAIAERCRAEFVEIPIGPADGAGLLAEVVAHGEPLLDPTALGWWALARTAWERGVDSLLGGLGGTELFGGPSVYFTARASALPGATLLGRAARATGVARLGSLAEPWAHRHLRRQAGLGPDESPWDAIDALAATCPTTDPAGAALWLDRRLALAEGSLATFDRAAAAHGLRAQSPYADPRLALLVASIPIAHLVQVRRHRGLFLDAMAERFAGDPAPPAPMALPVDAWLADAALTDGVPDALDGIVDPAAVRALLGGTAPASRRWRYVALAAWRRANGA